MPSPSSPEPSVEAGPTAQHALESIAYALLSSNKLRALMVDLLRLGNLVVDDSLRGTGRVGDTGAGLVESAIETIVSQVEVVVGTEEPSTESTTSLSAEAGDELADRFKGVSRITSSVSTTLVLISCWGTHRFLWKFNPTLNINQPSRAC